jgi:hypothetical protein
VRAWAAAAATALVLVLSAGAAQVASAGAAVRGGPRPVLAGAGQMHPDATGQECFFSFPACTSADPTVVFVMVSSGDSTGCTFTQDTSWGDKSADTVLTYNGAASGAALATFTHTYAAPGTFQITYTITVDSNPSGRCSGASGGLQFTLAAPPTLACQSSQVTVPATTPAMRPSERGVGITYGPVQLAFTPGQPGGGAQCTMAPAASSLPVDLTIPGVATPILLGQTDMTQTLNFFAANTVASTIPLCDFGSLQALASASLTPPLTDFAHTNNCFLTPTYNASWDVVARWTIPNGILQTALNQATDTDRKIYSTQPLTYYVDLDTLPLPQGFSGDTMSALVDFIYSTLAQDLPVLDRVALIQNPSAHLFVTNPFGHHIGLDSKNRTHTFPGVGYVEAGGRSLAWILEPGRGAYNLSVRGKSGSKFSVDMADLQFLGHGTAPLVENFAWNGRLGDGGTATRRFDVRGTALSPKLHPHESATRVSPLTRVHFTLADSVITLGTAKVLWQFGDGRSAGGSLAAHRYRKPGRYTPTVTVTDAVGYTVTAKLPVIVVKR